MGDDHQKPSIGKRFGEFLLYAVFVTVDAYELWHGNHLLCLAIAWIGALGLLLVDGQRRVRLVVLMAIITVILGGIYICEPQLPQETETNGLLVPANDATPRTACTPDDKGPPVTGQGWFFVTVAGGGVMTTTPDKRLTAISIDGQPTVVMDRSEQGIVLDVDMFNSNGALAVRIEKNQWTTSTTQTFRVTRPDTSTLSVVGIRGEELLWVRYMNANTVKIRGTFYKIGDPEPVVITDNSISRGHMQLYMAPTEMAVPFVPCFVVGTPDYRDPIFLFK